jgi:flavin reductase (DIM6/NTAB) family NADH-FMN oxidoreductase RutF
VTIHSSHPFADAEPDPVRRFRGRLGGAVALVTAGDDSDEGGRAGLTVSSLMVAHGEPARLLALVDPDSDLADAVERTGRAVVQLLAWSHRDLAEAFAGTAPAPGGPFRTGDFVDTAWGPRLADAPTWAATSLEEARTIGWSSLLSLVVEEIHVGEDDEPLVSRRGRWQRPERG